MRISLPYRWVPSILVLLLALVPACGPAWSQPAALTGPAPTVTPTQGMSAGARPVITPDASACSVTSGNPTPGPTQASLFPPVSAADWSLGPDNAAVSLVMYSDFQCAYCAQVGLILQTLAAEFPNDLRVVFRHFPLDQDDKAILAAQAAEAAGLQGQDRFWAMYTLLYGRQADWVTLDPQQFNAWLVQQAPALGLEAERFSADLTSQTVIDRVAAAKQAGTQIGIPGAPLMLIDGEIWSGPKDLSNLRVLVRSAILADRQFTGCPPMTIDLHKQYLATLKTDKGDIVIQLYPDQAPFTVNSFIFLANQGWYDGVTFFRVVSSPDIAQTGDPSGTGWGTPGYTFKDEISPSLSFDRPGVVAMANMGPNTNGSQFFITKSAQPGLDGQYTIFGQVISGMEVVAGLTPRDPLQIGSQTGQEALSDGDKILQVSILEK